MLITEINAIIFYTNTPLEVMELNEAVIPMAEHINAVAKPHEKRIQRAILGCQTFRYREVDTFKEMLLRAAKDARVRLCEYFPGMQDEKMAAVERLEDATHRYYDRFKRAVKAAVPIP